MQEAIVAIIVVCAAWVVAKRYVPKTIRQTVRTSIVVAAKRFGWNGIARKLEMKIQSAPTCADGCSSCEACGAFGTIAAKKKLANTAEALKRTASR